MVVFNYTKIKRREKRIYTFFDITISSSGIVANSLITSGILLGIFTVFGLIFCAITKTFWYNPVNLAKSSKVGYFYLIFIILPIVLGMFLNSYKIQNYKLIDFIKIYFIPKIPLNQDGRRVKLDKYEINSFIERI